MYRLFDTIKNTHFDSFLPSACKFGIVYTISYRCFSISSRWTKLHTELVCLKQLFSKINYPKNVINKSFKKFINNILVVKETKLIVEKKSLFVVLVYLDSVLLQTRAKLKKSLKKSLIIEKSKECLI